MQLGYKRFPTVERKISEIGPEDVRVSIIGTVVDRSENKIVLDDGTGTIEIFAGDDLIKDSKGKKTLRIIGRVVPENGIKINAEIIQDFSGFNKDLYERVKEKFINNK